MYTRIVTCTRCACAALATTARAADLTVKLDARESRAQACPHRLTLACARAR